MRKAAEVTWARKDAAQQLAEELDGTYLLRTDRTELAEAEVWKLYVLLTRIERSFRYLKSNLGMFHQRSERVDAHIFISLLAYHLLHAIERRLQEHGDHRSWPTIRDLLATHQSVHQCTNGTVLRLRRPSQPELEHRDLPDAADTHPAAARKESIVVTNVKSRYSNNLRQKMLNLG